MRSYLSLEQASGIEEVTGQPRVAVNQLTTSNSQNLQRAVSDRVCNLLLPPTTPLYHPSSAQVDDDMPPQTAAQLRTRTKTKSKQNPNMEMLPVLMLVQLVTECKFGKLGWPSIPPNPCSKCPYDLRQRPLLTTPPSRNSWFAWARFAKPASGASLVVAMSCRQPFAWDPNFCCTASGEP